MSQRKPNGLVIILVIICFMFIATGFDNIIKTTNYLSAHRGTDRNSMSVKI